MMTAHVRKQHSPQAMLSERDEKRGTLVFGRTFFSFLEIFLSFFIKFGENGKNFNDKILKESFEKKLIKSFYIQIREKR